MPEQKKGDQDRMRPERLDQDELDQEGGTRRDIERDSEKQTQKNPQRTNR